MRKNLLYLVALMCSFSLAVMAQDSTSCSATEVLLTMTDSDGDGWGNGNAVVTDAAGNDSTILLLLWRLVLLKLLLYAWRTVWLL
ncbi:MAG: hypothetical protein P8N54_08060 [Flavobacteriales bacterium]|nr:hypothetical protein [Flavobacteriales bacterium]